MVHPQVRDDPREAARHELFIASRLLGVGAGIAAVPAYLALWGAPSLPAAIVFAWLLTPLAVAFYVSRTGRLEQAQIFSSISLAGLVGVVAALSGPASPILAWIVLVPAEAALWRSRRVMAIATGFAAAVLLGLAGAALAGYAPVAAELAGPAWAIPTLVALPAVFYLGAAAMGAAIVSGRIDAVAMAREGTFRALIEHGPDIIARQRRNGNVTYVSPAARRRLGLAEAELLGGGLFRRIHVLDRPAYLKALDGAVSGGEGKLEIRLRVDEGGTPDWRWMEMSCRPVPQEGHGGWEAVTVLRDITAAKVQEKGMANAAEQAERRSLAKTRFLARISHELRTPLNAIIGFSELLSHAHAGTLTEDKQREYAELIRDSGRHLLDLINDILDMSKIETGNFRIVPEPFDLAALVENCRQLLGPQATAAGLSIDSDLPVALPELVADRRACKQILLNLLHNAVKFSRPSGRIVIGAYVEGEAACVYVADEGIGIARKDLERLGQPFVQIHSSYDRNYEGAGLGLSVVKGLVALHGGSLEIDSTPGVGTRVTVRLPLAAASSDPAPGQEEPIRMRA